MSRYVIGFWCVKGNGHLLLVGDDDFGACGNGFDVYVDASPADVEYLPAGEWA